MSDCPEPDLSSDVNIQLHVCFDFLTKAISNLRENTESMTQDIGEISKTGNNSCLFA